MRQSVCYWHIRQKPLLWFSVSIPEHRKGAGGTQLVPFDGVLSLWAKGDQPKKTFEHLLLCLPPLSEEALAQKGIACVLFSSPGFFKGSIQSAEGEAKSSLGSHPQAWCSLSQLQSSWWPSVVVTPPPGRAERTPGAGRPSSTWGHAGHLQQGCRRQGWITLLRTMT